MKKIKTNFLPLQNIQLIIFLIIATISVFIILRNSSDVYKLRSDSNGYTVNGRVLFSKDKIKQFKDNKTLKIYMQSNIKTLFVDYDEIKEKAYAILTPDLKEIVDIFDNHIKEA